MIFPSQIAVRMFGTRGAPPGRALGAARV